ncbi:MAG: GNAT family protein [Polyangiaceae bacterium]
MSALPAAVLQGRFVRLEPLSLAHLPGLLAAANGARDTFGFTNVPAGEAEMRAYVEEGAARHAKGEALPFATIDLRHGEPRVVGSTRFANAERWSWPFGFEADRPASIDAIEIGWTWLAPSAQRTAVNSEAKLLMLTHAFEAWRVLRVTLKTDARNARSRAAIERIGGKLDGVLRAHMPAFTGAAGEIRDTAIFSILRAEWPNVRERLEGFVAQRSA